MLDTFHTHLNLASSPTLHCSKIGPIFRSLGKARGCKCGGGNYGESKLPFLVRALTKVDYSGTPPRGPLLGRLIAAILRIFARLVFKLTLGLVSSGFCRARAIQNKYCKTWPRVAKPTAFQSHDTESFNLHSKFAEISVLSTEK